MPAEMRKGILAGGNRFKQGKALYAPSGAFGLPVLYRQQDTGLSIAFHDPGRNNPHHAGMPVFSIDYQHPVGQKPRFSLQTLDHLRQDSRFHLLPPDVALLNFPRQSFGHVVLRGHQQPGGPVGRIHPSRRVQPGHQCKHHVGRRQFLVLRSRRPRKGAQARPVSFVQHPQPRADQRPVFPR